MYKILKVIFLSAMRFNITKNRFRAVMLCIFLTIITSCSSMAHRSFSCKETTDLFGYSIIAGVVFQIGDCSVFKNVHFETGQYYSTYKDRIDWEIQTYDPNDSPREILRNFAKSYNCSEESYKLFSDMVYLNREKIFSKNYDNSPRKVSSEVISLINQDPVLSSKCN